MLTHHLSCWPLLAINSWEYSHWTEAPQDSELDSHRQAVCQLRCPRGPALGARRGPQPSSCWYSCFLPGWWEKIFLCLDILASKQLVYACWLFLYLLVGIPGLHSLRAKTRAGMSPVAAAFWPQASHLQNGEMRRSRDNSPSRPNSTQRNASFPPSRPRPNS